MEHFEGMTDEERLARLEEKATEIRKLLLGTLLLAKDLWRDELIERPEGIDVMTTMEEAEEVFVDGSLTGRLDRLWNAFSVIGRRAETLFRLMEYLSRYGKI